MDFRGDPANELIAATSVVHKLPLVTRDSGGFEPRDWSRSPEFGRRARANIRDGLT